MQTITIDTLKAGDVYRFAGHTYQVARIRTDLHGEPAGLTAVCAEQPVCHLNCGDVLATSPRWGEGHHTLGARGRHPIGAREVELIDRS